MRGEFPVFFRCTIQLILPGLAILPSVADLLVLDAGSVKALGVAFGTRFQIHLVGAAPSLQNIVASGGKK